jgi:hypothetical protein
MRRWRWWHSVAGKQWQATLADKGSARWVQQGAVGGARGCVQYLGAAWLLVDVPHIQVGGVCVGHHDVLVLRQLTDLVDLRSPDRSRG